jgi:hypothetical protein
MSASRLEKMSAAGSYTTAVFSVGAGIWLFFLLRWLESSVLPGPASVFPAGALNALAEETGKLCLFPLFRLFCRLTRPDKPPRNTAAPGLYALLAVMTFAIVENSVYFLRFPTTAIYLRLPYSYSIHLVTGTAFALMDLAGSYLFTPLLLTAAAAYHTALNSLSLAAGSPLMLAAAGAVNILLLMLLAGRWRNTLTVRRLMNAGS